MQTLVCSGIVALHELRGLSLEKFLTPKLALLSHALQDVSQQTVLTQPVLYSETMLAKRRNFLLDQVGL